mgnify:CR=1 FL=1
MFSKNCAAFAAILAFTWMHSGANVSAGECAPCGGGVSEKAASHDLVELASSDSSFSTLVAVVKAAGLVETLKGEGPFTVFAPTDEAFAKLPAGTVEELLKPENREKLKAILTYHVVPGKVTADRVVKLHEAKTAQGQSVSIKSEGGTVTIDQARVLKTDIHASNGVIHVIDAVILPRS